MRYPRLFYTDDSKLERLVKTVHWWIYLAVCVRGA
jgi:hypothetical protein